MSKPDDLSTSGMWSPSGKNLTAALNKLSGSEPVVYDNPKLGIKATFTFGPHGHLAKVSVMCPCGEVAEFTNFPRRQRFYNQFVVREWINSLSDDQLHDLGRAWDAAFRQAGPGRMKAQESVRAALFRCAPSWVAAERALAAAPPGNNAQGKDLPGMIGPPGGTI